MHVCAAITLLLFFTPGYWISLQLQETKGDPSKMQTQLPGLLKSHGADKFDFISVLNPR